MEDYLVPALRHSDADDPCANYQAHKEFAAARHYRFLYRSACPGNRFFAMSSKQIFRSPLLPG